MTQNLGIAYSGAGNHERAVELLTESVELARGAGDPAHLTSALRTLARLRLDEDDQAPGLELLHEALEISRDLMERPGIAEILDSLAAVVGRRDDPRTGALLIGAADGVRAVGGVGAPARRGGVAGAGRGRAARGAGRRGVRGRARRGRARWTLPRPWTAASSCRSAHADVDAHAGLLVVRQRAVERVAARATGSASACRSRPARRRSCRTPGRRRARPGCDRPRRGC